MAKSQKQRQSPGGAGPDRHDPDLIGLIERSGFIFIGSGAHRPEGGGGGAHGAAGGVRIEEVLLSTDALRGLAGRQATLTGGERGPHQDAVLFTNIISLGSEILLRVEGETEATESQVSNIREHIRWVGQQPLRRRVEGADLIITGKVLGSRPAHEPRRLRSEHDPDWWLAKVKVQTLLKGETKQSEIEVLFPNSRDIAWANSPKLHEGDSGILLLREVGPKAVVAEVNRAVYQVTDPLDFLPIERLREIETILDHENGEH